MPRCLTMIAGFKYGRLTFTGEIEVRKIQEAKRVLNVKFGLFICECGSKGFFNMIMVNKGHTKSCGCYRKDLMSTHGMHDHKLYKVLRGMKQRCYNPKSTWYHRYGGRGITIYQEWLDNFESFYTWAVNNGYSEGLTIEREDNDLGYNPDNCKWVTMREQGQNRSTTVKYLYNGQLLTASAISHITGINLSNIMYWIKKGKSMDEVIQDFLTRPAKISDL